MRKTKAEFARYRGVTAAAVTKMVKTGRIVVGADNKIHVETADNMLDGNALRESDEERQRLDELSSDITEEKLKHERAKRQLAELKVKEAEGRLIPIDVIKKADFQTLRTWRDTLLGVADRISPRCAATTDEREVNAMIIGELRPVLEAMANGVDYGRAGDKVTE